MGRRVQLIRHSTGAADAFVGLQGEISVDITKKEFRLGDGLTAGGIPQARADLENVDGATTSVDGKLVASDKQKLAFLTLTQAVDLDAMEALLAFITVTQNVNLDTIEADVATAAAELAFIAITQAVDLDAIESAAAASKVITDWIAVTQAVDLDTMESNIATNNSKVTNANHTGDVTGSTALTIGANKVLTAMILNANVTLAKMANMATASFMGRNTAGSGVPEILSAAVARAILNIENNADVTDTTNVTSAGALMDSEIDADLKTLSLPANVIISTFIKTLLDDAAASNARTTLGVDAAGTVNYTHPDHSGHASSAADGAITLLVAAITGQTALTSGLADADEILINDGGVIKRMDVSVMNAYFNSALVFKTPVKDHGSKAGNYTLQLDEAELHLVAFSANATLTIASSLANDKATVVIKNNNYTITLAGINNDSPTLTKAASKQDFVGLVKSFGKISAVAFRLNIATS